ncbi:hypothetical protein [Niabella aurantiaca]|nr:hypothetical protein [Niabella aurantiaca]
MNIVDLIKQVTDTGGITGLGAIPDIPALMAAGRALRQNGIG